MDLSSVDLNLLVHLDLLLETGSVREAARRAHVTPSAMSHALARLRVLLDDELMVRAGNVLVRTPRADALVVPVRDLLAHTRAVLSPPERFDPAALRRAFRVVCTDHVSTVLLGRAHARLAREAPGVDLHERAVLPESMGQLRSGEVDVAIGVFPEAPPEVRSRRLFTDGFVTVASRHHPRLRDGLSLASFLSEGHVLAAPRGVAWGHVDDELARIGQTRRIVRTVPNFLAALWHVVETDLLLTVSRRLVAATAGRLPVQVFPTPIRLDDYAVSLVWHPRVDGVAEDAWFRDVLVRAAAELTD